MKAISRAAAGLALLLCATSDAGAFIHHGNPVAVTPPATQYPLSNYQALPNGWPGLSTTMPIGVWLQKPQLTSAGVDYSGAYADLSHAAAASGINVMVGLFGSPPYPEGFGTDSGEMAAIKGTPGMKVIAGVIADTSSNSTTNSVTSLLSLVNGLSAQANLIGIGLGDEPNCGNTAFIPPTTAANLGQFPATVTAGKVYDSTRIWYSNFFQKDHYTSCPTQLSNAFASLNINSHDTYEMTSPFVGFTNPGLGTLPAHAEPSDFISRPRDWLWYGGLQTRLMIEQQTTPVPYWAFIGSGGDDLASSYGPQTFTATVTSGSSTIVNVSAAQSGNDTNVVTIFTTSWLNSGAKNVKLTGTGIPATTCVIAITDTTHATLGQCGTSTPTNATATTSGGFEEVTIASQGAGDISSCLHAFNICLASGNSYRDALADVSAMLWQRIINGAYAPEWFCYDTVSPSFCLGASAGGTDATNAQANIAYLDTTLQSFAALIQLPHVGQCSMQDDDGVTLHTSCTQGILTLATNTAGCPAQSIVNTDPLTGDKIVISQTDRASTTTNNCGVSAGATITTTLSGLATQVATVLYDSNSKYDPTHDTTGATHTLSGGAFTDTLGDNGDSYRTKIYRVH